MKYIFITFTGLAFPIAYKLHQEGNEVIVGQIQDIKEYVPENEITKAHENKTIRERRLLLYQGILDIQPAGKVIDMMRKIKNPYDYFVFFEENNLYRWADKIRTLGFEGNFPTRQDFEFEIDRDAAKEFVKKNYPKLHVPNVHEFTSVKEAIKFLRKSNDIWVLKAKGTGIKTYVPDIDDSKLANFQIIEMLKTFRTKYEKVGFILEQYIPSIIELTPEKMYYDGVPLATTIDIENKSFGSGNISVQTGCAEDLVFPTDKEDKINKIAFPPIVDEMARKHKGLFIWDASLLINKKDGKMYFGEFCSNRPGYNAFFTELAQCPSVNDFFERVVHKNSPFTLGTVGTSVRIFNLNRDENEQYAPDMRIDFKPETEKDLWLWDVKKNSRGKLVSVGSDWNLAVMTGAGKTIDDAVMKTYRNIEDGFSFVGAYYRSLDDYLSLDYPTSILNRLNYGLDKELYKLPFDVKVGDIEPKRHVFYGI